MSCVTFMLMKANHIRCFNIWLSMTPKWSQFKPKTFNFV